MDKYRVFQAGQTQANKVTFTSQQYIIPREYHSGVGATITRPWTQNDMFTCREKLDLFTHGFAVGLSSAPLYAGEIGKRSCISTVRSNVHIDLLRNWTFRKRSSKQRYLKAPALRLRVDGERFENGAEFRKRWHLDNHAQFFWNRNPMTGDYWVYKFLRRMGDKTFAAFSNWKRRFQIWSE